MFCRTCGNPIPETSNFCPTCGAGSQRSSQDPSAPLKFSPQQPVPQQHTTPPVSPPKKKHPIRKVAGFLLITCCALGGVFAFFQSQETERSNEDDKTETVDSSQVTLPNNPEPPSDSSSSTELEWVYYWYLCGSDLESELGAATADLREMLSVTLPDSVAVVIQTGGSTQWSNRGLPLEISPDHTQRYLYQGNQLTLLENLPQTNMGDPQTLADFLSFAETNYQGNQTMLSLWNHGGGTSGGVCSDENFAMDALSLKELNQVMEAIYGDSPQQPPLDVIGFDACLMASIETAAIFDDYAQYMVASATTEPGIGWEYSYIFDALAKNPTISPLELSVSICDGYDRGCTASTSGGATAMDATTLSVLDLQAVDHVIQMYDYFLLELFLYCYNDSGYFPYLTEIATLSLNESDYNLVDLGHLAQLAEPELPYLADDLSLAVENLVVYQVSGDYIQDSTGITGYYPFQTDSYEDYLTQYGTISTSDYSKYFYQFMITQEISEGHLNYLSSVDSTSFYDYFPATNHEDMDTSKDPTIYTIHDFNFEDAPLTVEYMDGVPCALLSLNPEVANTVLSEVYLELTYFDMDTDLFFYLGTDYNLFSDREAGLYWDNFNGFWPALDGEYCTVLLTHQNEKYNNYDIPILLNGVSATLEAYYDWDLGTYSIAGVRMNNQSGFGERLTHQLQIGDQIEMVYHISNLDGDSQETYSDPIIVDENTEIYDIEMGDGTYAYNFIMGDALGNIARSELAVFETIGDTIYVSLLEDYLLDYYS